MVELEIVELARRARSGDVAAREELVTGVYGRLVRLSRKMLRDSSHAVRRWEETGDLAHRAWIRIQRSLEAPELELADDAHFFRLAAMHVRHELIDLYRKHSGPQGLAANHQTHALQEAGSALEEDCFQANVADDPRRMAVWAEFHWLVDRLADKQKEVMDLLWYQQLTQQQAAVLLGVEVKTVKRRWRDAKISLASRLDRGLIEI